MTAVIPMAGRGSRFLSAGFTLPKFLIEVKGKTLLQYSLESLPLEIFDNIIFIGLSEHEDEYKVSVIIDTILHGKPFHWISLKETTRGQAETVLMASSLINPQKDLVIYNIDTYFQSSTLKQLLLSDEKRDGILGYMKDSSPNWSFASIEAQTGIVLRTTEKDPISDNALTGMYHFTQAADFLDVSSAHIEANLTTKNEFYIAPMYNDLIKKGRSFVLDFAEQFVALGTPEDVKKFAGN